MPVAHNGSVECYYETDGSGETVAFVGDAGYGPWLWGWQYASVAGPFEALVTALRGSDGSSAPEGPYSLDALAHDLDAVFRDHGSRKVHLVGAGLGALVALQYARAFGRARSLVLIGGAATGGELDRDALRDLHPDPADEAALRDSLDGAFSPAFLEARPDLIERIVGWRAKEDATLPALDAQLAAVEGFDAGPLYELDLPALVLSGVDDPVVSTEAGEGLANGLPYGRFEAVEGKRLCFVEHSAAVTDELLTFWEGL